MVRWVGACGTLQTKGNFIRSLGRKNLRETDHWEDLGVDGCTFIGTLRDRFGEREPGDWTGSKC